MAENNTIMTDNPEAKFESGKDHVKKAAEDLKAAATAKAGEFRDAATAKAQELRDVATSKAQEFRSIASQKAEDFSHRASQAWEGAEARAKTMREDGEKIVREKPLQAVLAAFATGLVLGLLIRR